MKDLKPATLHIQEKRNCRAASTKMVWLFLPPWRSIQLKKSVSGESGVWISLNKVEWINNKLSGWWNMSARGNKKLARMGQKYSRYTHTQIHTHPRKWRDSSGFELELSIFGQATQFPSESQVWTIKFPVIKGVYDNQPPLLRPNCPPTSSPAHPLPLSHSFWEITVDGGPSALMWAGCVC